MDKKIICPNCGAAIAEDEAKCPYCGSTNIKGAEKEYLHKLEEMKEDMGDLYDDPVEELKAMTKKGTKRWIKIAMIPFVLMVLFIILGVGLSTLGEDKNTLRKEYEWKQENYPKLDALYEAGDYDGMVDMYYQLLKDKYAVVYDWEHYDLLRDYTDLTEMDAILKKEKLSDYNYEVLLYAELRARAIASGKKYNAKEKQNLSKFFEEAEADFNARWNMSDEEYSIFEKYMADEDATYKLRDQCRKYVEKWLKEKQ